MALADNPSLSTPLTEDRFLFLKQQAFEAIAEARRRSDPHYLLYDESEAADGRNFLRRLTQEARRMGKPRGDRTTAGENQRMLAVLGKLESGQTLKEIAIDEVGAACAEGRQKSLSTLVNRFSRRVCEIVRKKFGYLPKGIENDQPQAMSYLRLVFQDSPGFCFPDHLPGLRQAIKRGLAQKQRRPAVTA